MRQEAAICQRVRWGNPASPVCGNTSKDVTVSTPARIIARCYVKPGLETMQAVMRKREGIEPRQTTPFRGGRASTAMRRQHPSRLRSRWAPPGSETMACMEGKLRNLGDLQRVGSTVQGPDPEFDSKGWNPSREQFPLQKSDVFIVVSKQGNACGAKGDTVGGLTAESPMPPRSRRQFRARRRRKINPTSVFGALGASITHWSQCDRPRPQVRFWKITHRGARCVNSARRVLRGAPVT